MLAGSYVGGLYRIVVLGRLGAVKVPLLNMYLNQDSPSQMKDGLPSLQNKLSFWRIFLRVKKMSIMTSKTVMIMSPTDL